MMSDLGEWRRLCALIDDDQGVRLAVEDALDSGADPWDALIGGLDDAGALAYLRSDDTGMELSEALAQLPRVFALQPDLDEVTDTDDLNTAMRVADRLLAQQEMHLLRLIEADEDSWPVVVVARASIDAIVAIADSLGYRVARS